MKKIALLVLVFCVLDFGCKTHKKITSVDNIKTDSTRTISNIENIGSRTDSNVSFLTGSVLDLGYNKKTTITEYDTDKPAINPTTQIILNGFWSLPVSTTKGKVYTDVTDTSRKAVFDSTNKKVIIYKDGKVENTIHGAAQTGLAYPIKKKTEIDETYNLKKNDSTKYWAQKRKQDSLQQVKNENLTVSTTANKSQNLDQGTNVSGLRIFIPFFIGLAILIAILVIIYVIYKKLKK